MGELAGWLTLVTVLVTALGVGVLLVVLYRRIAAGRQQADELTLRVEALGREIERTEHAVLEEFGRNREEQDRQARAMREEVGGRLNTTADGMLRSLGEITQAQRQQLDIFSRRLEQLIGTMEQKHDGLRGAVEQKLSQIQSDNATRLEEMRRTVDEKLQGTLEKRLGESFRQVSERLEQVYRGLGEMQALASGVGDLKRVLTNVKTRGIWGEIALGNLLEQILTPDQFAVNVATRPGSNERVEYAVKLPGRGDDENPVWLPIDAKFPKEDYERLQEAADAGDADGVARAAQQLETRIKAAARDIHEKYVSPPATTDFALMFLPTEGLYAEVLRRTGLLEALQRDLRVVVAGPTTIAAILNSLQMGFRTLAIEQRSSEVWKLLGAVRTEFGKFGDTLDKVKKKLDAASTE
ncbi:MAG: DNA recombination protein RmuC, partial [Acidobacteria bacterium]|nr:DNA recombination protein RmuC [Acidobacteriota bacterium]